ncbi:glycosyltransferase family 8 protein [Helicobacter pullorum]|uniref:glycosyltransferase family 8 protein n=1 Tax=Helicobacter pullorum TaxID=35818 RepID=UPI00242F2752|nr:glycosyltransferase family 8 protein [Helicobacter pullorum]
MFHIVFNADEKYIPYAAVLMTSIIKNTNPNKTFADFCVDSNQNETINSSGGGGHLENPNNLNPAFTKESQTSQIQKSINQELKSYLDSTLQDSTDSNHNFTNEGYVFHILSDFVSDESRLKLKNLKDSLCLIYPCEICIHILSDEEFRDSPKWKGNYLAYYRLKIPSVLPKEVNKCLYLDIDMLALGDIREVFAIELGDKMAGVVGDFISYCDVKMPLKADKERFDNFKLKEYFNSGFLLMNLKLWREYHIERQCFEILLRYVLIRCPDQDILNIVLRDKVLVLSQKYNFFNRINLDIHCKDSSNRRNNYDYTLDETRWALENTLIVHYLDTKPWDKIYACGMNDKYELISLRALRKYTYKFYKPWWEMALQTPIFNQELLNRLLELNELNIEKYSRFLAEKLKARDEITEKKLVEVANTNKEQSIKISQLCDEENRNKNSLETTNHKIQQIQESLDSLEQEIKNTKKVYGAKERIQNHLSFKIGKALLESKGFWSRIWLPIILYQIRKQHNKSLEIYTQICRVNPTLKLLPLESYSDYKEVLEEKESKAYNLGVEFMKAYKGREVGKLFRMLFVNN